MNSCKVHRIHIPKVSVCDVHHVWPRGDGGPDVPENKVTICPSGHRNCHELLNVYKHKNGSVSKQDLKSFSRGEQKLAQLGWDRIQRKAL